jgi:glycosyltransferase involved in cell wall biosynthesis
VVLGVHDVSFFAHPEWFGWKEGLRLRVLARQSARRAARILACSEFTRREILRHLGSAADRVDVIYLGAPAARIAGHAPAAAGGEHLVLYVGSVFARRHIPELIAGFTTLAARHPHVQLAIVGENRSTPPIDLEGLVAGSPAAARIRAVPYAPEDELRSLYERAAAFVFLSDYEGFGLTPLEALAAGIPIVVLDTVVAREIYGPAACYVARPDPALVTDALDRVLFDAGERARILSAAPGLLARYSWDECAARTLQVLLASAR